MTLTVRDVMTVNVQTVGPDATLTELDELMTKHKVSGVPVVEDGDRLVGVVSRADVVRVLYAEQKEARRVSAYYSSPFPLSIPDLKVLARDSRKIADHMTELRVKEVMSGDPETVTADKELQDVAGIMSANRYHRLPVVDANRLIGIVSSLDLVRALAEVGLKEK